MRSMNRFKLSRWLSIVFACCALLFIAASGSAEEKALHLDFDSSDPIKLNAHIMEINHAKAQLVVAEELVYVVDFMIGEHRFFTEVTDSKGNPSEFGSFKVGEYVVVEGFKTSDGVVFASLLQKTGKQKFKSKLKH